MRTFLQVAWTAVALLAAGCAGKPAATDPSIQAKDNVFAPATYLTEANVDVGWKNVGRNFHTVTVQDPKKAAGNYLLDQEIQPGQNVTFLFPSTGTYDVFCRYHSQGAAGDFSGGMVMKVTVT